MTGRSPSPVCGRSKESEHVVPTINQLVRKGRRRKRKLRVNRALQGCPQKSGVVLRIWVSKPRKPNSGHRKLARVRLSNGVEVTAGIPGQGLGGVQEHSHVLVRGGRTKDVPGVKFQIVRGTLDCTGENGDNFRPTKTMKGDRRRGRSKYGSKRPRTG